MNFLFRLFVFLGGLVVIALFAALIAPYFIDWDEFTEEFEAQASRVIGQEVRVGGKTNLRLLPLPFLSFEDLRVGRNPDGTPLMTVDKFSFTSELLPFLSGQVRIVDMSMLKPKMNLQVAQDGTIAWTKPQASFVNPEQVNIEKLKVENGSVIVTGLVDQRSLHLENIQGDFTAKSILGPWRIEAFADVEGIPAQINAATGSLQDDDSLRLKLDLNRLDEPYRLLLDGPIKLENQALSWNGEFKLSPFTKLQVEAMDKPREPLSILASGQFNASPKQITIPQYQLDAGALDDPYTITGQGIVDIQDNIYFKMQADGRQIDIDQLDPAETNVEKATLETRLKSLVEILKRVPIPTAKGEVDVILPAIVVGDTFIRDIETNISPTGSGWVIRRLKATLPGNTKFEANGRLGLKNGFGFSGEVLIASRQPSGFADWVSGSVDETFRRLKSVGLAADIIISPRQTTLENVELRLDDALLKGKLQRLSANEDRPAIIAELRGNIINVDDLAAIYSLTKSSNNQKPYDLNIKVKADLFEAMVGNKPLTAESLDANVQVREGTVSIEHLNASSLLGAKISTKGRIENVLSKPNGNMKLQLNAKDATGLLAFGEQFLGDNAFLKSLQSRTSLTKDTNLDIELDTTALTEGAKGLMIIKGISGGSNLSLQIGFDGKLDDLSKMPLTIDGSLTNPVPSALLQQLGIQTLPVDLQGEIEGALKLDFTLQGIGQEGFDTRVSVAGEGGNLSATGKLITSDWNTYETSLNVTLGAENITPYLGIVDLPFFEVPTAEALPLSLSLQFNKTKRDLQFEKLKGQLANNQFSGNLLYQKEFVARPRLSGDLMLKTLDLPLIAEAVFARTTSRGNALGISQEIALSDNTNFGETLLAGLDASVLIESNKLNLGKGFSGKGSKLQLSIVDGAVDLNDLSFSFLEGQFNGGLNLKNTAGSVLANINYTLQNVEAERFTKAINSADFVKGKMSINGALESTGQSFSALVANLSGNGFAILDEGYIEGLNPDGFSPILDATNIENYEITPDKIKILTEQNLLKEGFKVSKLDVPFSVNRGRLRARNINYALENVSFSSDAEIELKSGKIKANTIVEFKPYKKDVYSGVDPQVVVSWQGAIADLKPAMDTDRIEGYLSLRAFEISQRRLETLEAQVMEKQRLRGHIAYAFAQETYIERKKNQESEAIRLEEERRLRELEEAKRIEEERKLREAEKAKQLAEEQVQKEAEALKILQAEEKRAREEQAKQQAQAEQDLEIIEPLEPAISPDILDSVKDFLNTN